MSLLVDLILLSIFLVLFSYAIRHYRFYWNRTFGVQGEAFERFAGAYTPSVSILCPMRNEEKVASRLLSSLVEMDYNKDNGRYEVIAIDDNSTDRTPQIIDEYAAKCPFVKAIHRSGSPILSKPAALNAGLTFARNKIVLFFDADYIPPKDCVKKLVAPFTDPLVAGVMGRVVPVNPPETMLSRVFEIERAAGYQIDQQARHNLGLIPQYGGTVGGFRRAFLSDHGRFDPYHMAEDTDVTYKAYLSGWKICYVNTVECYEEAATQVRQRGAQVRRWTIGHNYCMFDYALRTITSRFLTFWSKLDGIMLLGVYLQPFLILSGWALGIYSYLFEPPFWSPLLVALFLTLSYNVVGNLGLFSEIGSALYLDRRGRSIWLTTLMLPTVLYYVAVESRGFIRAVLAHLTVRRRRRKAASESRTTVSKSEAT